MKVQFIGATHEVTGSCTLLEVNGRYYLVDCGMEQGEDIFQNVPLPVPANAIEAVFLTHAHIDHSGMLPKLCKDGFRGQIYATESTCNLCRIMLMDSAHIQESEAQWRTRKAERAGERAVEPVYDTNDAAAALRGQVLSIRRADAKLPEGSVFIADLIGLPVLADGETVGTLTDILCRPGNDVYVVTAADKKREYLIPAVPEFILERNVDEGYIRVRLIEGMQTDAL